MHISDDGYGMMVWTHSLDNRLYARTFVNGQWSVEQYVLALEIMGSAMRIADGARWDRLALGVDAIREVCRTAFRQWAPVTRDADTISFMLWTADGSEILDYRGRLDEPLEWARYIGLRLEKKAESQRLFDALKTIAVQAGAPAPVAVPEAVLDIGLNEPVKGSKVFTALKGLLDAGMEIPHGEEIFPSDERISGEWRKDEKFSTAFEEIKTKIMEASG
jgi:ribosomal protein L18